MLRKLRAIWSKLDCLKSSPKLYVLVIAGKTPGYNQFYRLPSGVVVQKATLQR
jgi:hypothetical protein